MLLNSTLTRQIFEGRYPQEMLYQNYLNLLERGFELLKNTAKSIDNYKELTDLKAIRIALEYRFEMMRRARRKQLATIGEFNVAFA